MTTAQSSPAFIRMEGDVPVLAAWKFSDLIWRVWCEHEYRWHEHGAENGHRVAHCSCPLSPYKETGYIIELAGDFKNREPRLRMDYRRHLKCPGYVKL